MLRCRTPPSNPARQSRTMRKRHQQAGLAVQTVAPVFCRSQAFAIAINNHFPDRRTHFWPAGTGQALAGMWKWEQSPCPWVRSRRGLYCRALFRGRPDLCRSHHQGDQNNAGACPQGRTLSKPQSLVRLRSHRSGRPEVPYIIDVFRAEDPILHYLRTGDLAG